MKILFITPIVIILSLQTSFAKKPVKKGLKDSHSTIYTEKIKRVVNAIDIGNFTTDKSYLKMLATACKRNQCSPLETQTIQSVGEQIIHCKIKHLKAHGIENPDANSICESTQAMYGCDSLPSQILRKMCYTGNNYSLSVWKQKERKFKSRMPASK